MQIHFVKTPIESPKLDSLAYWFSSKQEQHQLLLRDYCYQYATDFSFSDSTWYETDILSSSFPVSKDQLAAFYRSRTPAVLSDSAYFYVLKVNDYKSGGEIAPLDYVKTDITRILMNNRKMRLLRSTYETIYQEALLNKEFEIYP
ncbi:MAG: hypothetical protein KatS3mg031_2514 [Chitinophagales bacterium]|nr:MAG: hypothetical protein KatS3mg031_2514 [Chitinophagales bacterium]